MLCAAAVVFLAFVYVHLFAFVARTSDDANGFLAGLDIAHGNWRLHGWWLPADNFWTSDAVLYAILIRLVGPHPALMYWHPAIAWAMLVVAASVLAARASMHGKHIWAILPVVILIGLPPFWNNPIMALITASPMHVVTLVYVLVIFWLAESVLLNVHPAWPWLLLPLGIISVLAAAGDPFAIPIGLVPVCLAALAMTGGRIARRSAVLVVVMAGCGIGRWLVAFNRHHGGFQTVHSSNVVLQFATFEEAIGNLSLSLQSILRLFGADFFGQTVTAAVPALIRIMLLALVGGAILVCLRGFLRSNWHRAQTNHDSQADFLSMVLVMGIILDVAAGVFSKVLVDIWSARFFFPVFVFGAVLLGRRAGTSHPAIKAYYLVALLSAVWVTNHGYAQTPHRMVFVDGPKSALVSWLEQRELTHGYGPYWSASLMTVVTRQKIQVRALVQDGHGGLQPFQWLAKREWYASRLGATRPFFVLYDLKPADISFAAADVLHTFGPPTETDRIGDYGIAIYR